MSGSPIDRPIAAADIIFALGFTPANAATVPSGGGGGGTAGVTTFNNRAGPVALSAADVDAALGYTPYSATNPAGYQTAGQVQALIPAPAAPFTLTAATASALGGVKQGAGTTIAPDGTISFAGTIAGTASTGVAIVQLSQHGIVSDAVNGLEWGIQAPAGAGQEEAINALIVASLTAATAMGLTGVRIIWDVAVAVGAPIFLHSNMTIEAPHYGCGAIVRAGANCPVFMVDGMQANMNGGAYTGVGATATQKTFGKFDPAFTGAAHPEYYRVFDPAFVNASHITLLGGTWNGNYFQQVTQPPGTQAGLPFIANDNIGYTSIMHFFGVQHLTLKGIRASNGTHFGLYFVNVGNALIEDCSVDQYMDRNYGSDCFHFGGPCQEIKLINPRTHCADDNIAINADDLGFDANEGIVPGVNWQCSGDIVDVEITNHIIWNGHENVIGWGGICFRSTAARIDRIVINGVAGTTQNWGIWFPNLTGGSQAALIPGPGNCGHITLRDVSFDVYQNANSPAAIYVNLNVECLEIIARYRRSAQACPDIVIAPAAVVGVIKLTDYTVYQPNGAPNNTQPVLVVNGTVHLLRMSGASYRDASVGTSAAPLLLVNAGGSVTAASLDVDAQGISNIVQNLGSIGLLSLRGSHRNAGGGSPLANSGSVASYIVGTGSLLVYSTAYITSYTGNAPTAINSYVEGAVTPMATAYTTSLSAASGLSGNPVTMTFTPSGGVWPTNTTITPTATLTGAFSPASLTPTGSGAVTVAFTPSAAATGSLSSATSNLTNTSGAQTYTATAAGTIATAYTTTLSASSGYTGNPVTVSFNPTGGSWPPGATITPSSTIAGAFSPTSLSPSGSAAVTMTFTPSAAASGTISSTGTGISSTTAPLAYSSSAIPLLVTDKITTPPLIAVSTARKLRGAYAGAAMQLRNPGGSTQDIGFVNNAVDQSGMTTFAGGGDAYGSKWYDQSGSGNNLAEASGTQPKIIAGGVITQEGASPAFPSTNPTGPSMLLDTAVAPAGITNTMTVIVVARATAGTGGILVSYANGGETSYGTITSACMITSGSGPATFGSDRNNVAPVVTTSAVNSLFVGMSQYDGSNANLSINGGPVVSAAVSGAFSGTGGVWVGAGFSGSTAAAPWQGTVCEVLIYTQALSAADITTITSDMRAYYGTP